MSCIGQAVYRPICGVRYASQTVTDAHGVGWSQTATDAHGVSANPGAGRHAPQLHELITVHTGWCERLSRLP